MGLGIIAAISNPLVGRGRAQCAVVHRLRFLCKRRMEVARALSSTTRFPNDFVFMRTSSFDEFLNHLWEATKIWRAHGALFFQLPRAGVKPVAGWVVFGYPLANTDNW